MLEQRIESELSTFERGSMTRRDLVARLSAIAAAAALGAPHDARAQPDGAKPTFIGTDLNHIALRVTDLERSRDFYERHLGLQTVQFSRWNCFMRCSENNFLAMFKGDKPGLDHYCFSIDDYDAAKVVETLKRVGLTPSRQENRVYFDDPDGIQVQIAAKGNAIQ